MRMIRLHRRGFAMVTAMCLIAMAGVAIAGVTALLAADVRRTLNGSADAELRQLLIVAEIDAPAHLSAASEAEWITPIPPGLSGEVRTRKIASKDGVRLHVTANLTGRKLFEELKFEQAADGWQLREAVLSPESHP